MKSKNGKKKKNPAEHSIFEIAVIATMSSGKSTIINALIGQDLLPAANAATTAKVTRIRDRDGHKNFWVQCKNKAGIPMTPRSKATPEKLKQYNANARVAYIDIDGDIPAIAGSAARLCFVDTPGPNNSATQEHREIMRSVLKDAKHKPLILYVLDATKPQDDSEAVLLEEIGDLLKREDAHSRIVFVLNKADMLDSNTYRDGTMYEVLERYRTYLKRIGLPEAPIFPVSAHAALLFRLKQKGIPISEKNERFLQMFCDLRGFSSEDLLPELYGAQIRCMKEQAIEKHDDAAMNIINTGIVGLELYISDLLPETAKKRTASEPACQKNANQTNCERSNPCSEGQ